MLLRLYPLIFILQAFCIYYAYTKGAAQKWYWIILFFPFIGSLFYLYDTFYSRDNISTIKEEFKSRLVSNYTIDKLENELQFSDTFTNRLRLADEHLNVGNHDRALELYESCTKGIYKNEPALLMKLVQTNYQLENYKEVVKYGEQLSSTKEYKNSRQKMAVAWSHFHLSDNHSAEKVFVEMNINFSNYEGRLEYAHFLYQVDKAVQSEKIIEELLEEISHMDAYERRLKKAVIKDIKQFRKQNFG